MKLMMRNQIEDRKDRIAEMRRYVLLLLEYVGTPTMLFQYHTSNTSQVRWAANAFYQARH